MRMNQSTIHARILSQDICELQYKSELARPYRCEVSTPPDSARSGGVLLLVSPRAPMNELHEAAFCGLAEHARFILRKGSIDIDECDSAGCSPLMYAALGGHSRVVQVLLERGANTSLVGGEGVNALHVSASYGQTIVTRMLVKAGADVEVTTANNEHTALHLAALRGHSEVSKALIAAGASVDYRVRSGETPLGAAARMGHVGPLKQLLAAKANPLLCATSLQGLVLLPLEAAAMYGRSGVVRELIGHSGVKGCGGPTGGASALRKAAEQQHVDIMTMLTRAGVADDGSALRAVALLGDEAAAKLLLRQRRGKSTGDNLYVNVRSPENGRTPLVACVMGCQPGCPRLLRTLLDAGADSAASVPLKLPSGHVSNFTPLELATEVLLSREALDISMTKEQLRVLARTRSVLMREEAIHAVTWLWPADPPLEEMGASRVAAAGGMQPNKVPARVRWTSARQGVLLPAIFRYSSDQSAVA